MHWLPKKNAVPIIAFIFIVVLALRMQWMKHQSLLPRASERKINLLYQADSKSASKKDINIVLDKSLLKLKRYLVQNSMQLCTSQMEFDKYLMTSHSLLPRLRTNCASGHLQLAMTKESLANFYVNRKDDYCLSFVMPTTNYSTELLVATPDFAINREKFASVTFGLIFPYWPFVPTTLDVPRFAFDPTLRIGDPYSKPYLIGFDLGSLQQRSSANEPLLITSLSTFPNLRMIMREATDTRCFPNGVSFTDVMPQYLPCSQAGDVLRNSTFCLIVVHNWEDLAASAVQSIHAQLWTCLKYRSIPVIPHNYELARVEKYLPFVDLLEKLWLKAIVFYPLTTAQDFIMTLAGISLVERGMRLDKGSKLFNRHLETVGKQVETVVATINKVLLLPQPMVPVVETHLTAQIANTQVRIYTPDQSWSQVRSTVNLSSTMDSACDRSSSVDFEGPLWTFDKTPWNMCNTHTANRSESANKFTAVFLTYDRFRSLINNIKYLKYVEELISDVVVVWNHPIYKPQSLGWPNTKYPIHVISMPSNKLQNRFLPFDLIRRDAVFMLDDDIIPDSESIKEGFRDWNNNPDELVGYNARSHDWLSKQSKFNYVTSSATPHSLILTSAAFFHKYFLYAYTFELSREVYASVDKLMNCEDIAMNMLHQQVTEKAPYKVDARTYFISRFRKNSLSFKKGHYEVRSTCITNFIHLFGYDPLLHFY